MENSKKKCIKNIVAILLLLIIASCNSQSSKKKIIINEEEMEQTKKETHNVFKDYQPARRFNISKFDANKKCEEYRFIDDNGMEVYQFASIESSSRKVNKYWENRKYPNTGYRFVCSYDANGLLLHSLTTFYNIEFGIVRHYDSVDNTAKEEDLNAPYKFSLDDLIDKMKDEYEIDILTPNLIWDVNRYVIDKENMPFYEVSVRDLMTDLVIHVYLIDGNTGEMLLITSRETEWNGRPEESVLDEYIRKKANGELK